MSEPTTTTYSKTTRPTDPIARVVHEVASTLSTRAGLDEWPVTIELANGSRVTGWPGDMTDASTTVVLLVAPNNGHSDPPRHYRLSHVVGAWWATDAEHTRLAYLSLTT